VYGGNEGTREQGRGLGRQGGKKKGREEETETGCVDVCARGRDRETGRKGAHT